MKDKKIPKKNPGRLHRFLMDKSGAVTTLVRDLKLFSIIGVFLSHAHLGLFS